MYRKAKGTGMAQTYAVIGANYGDEGKGLLVDYLTRTKGADIVVRHNGGAQAGHTVVLPDGQRHVFKHYGAGSFAGAATYLSRFFISNPILFREEGAQLANQFGLAPQVFVDANSLVTTPWDMMLNQAIERYRARTTGKRHGSVGVGINETVHRSQHEQHHIYSLQAADLHNLTLSTVFDKCRAISQRWVRRRLRELDMSASDPEVKEALEFSKNENILYAFLNDVQTFINYTTLVYNPGQALAGKCVVFEGAQGLALDQTLGEFPHVTRSNTGIRNVLTICEAAKLPLPHVVYVTRSYLTRHGAGRLPGESAQYVAADKTNMPHDWQGSLRFAPLDVQDMKSRIAADTSGRHLDSISLAVTHTDQLLGLVPPAKEIAGVADMTLGYESYGETYRDVIYYG